MDGATAMTGGVCERIMAARILCDRHGRNRIKDEAESKCYVTACLAEATRIRAVMNSDSSVLRSLFQLTWPMLVAQLAVMASGVIDTVMAGRLSAVDLAAVGIGNSIYITVFVTAMGVLLALTPIVAQLHGAGRMADMSLGIHCLLEDNPERARSLAQSLDAINRERRTRETEMRDEALAHLDATAQALAASVCVWQPGWHPGVIGLVASRLKETYWRPALAFAPDDADTLRGSGRSIPEVHLRDALDLVSKRLPGAILQFGGHAMAAGLTLRKHAFDDFSRQFDAAVRTLSGRDAFEPCLETDGSLEATYMTADTAALLAHQVWGSGFAPPLFQDRFRIVHQRLLKDRHLKLFLERDGLRLDAIWFNHAEPLPGEIEAVYRLERNTWGGQTTVQLLIEHARAA